MEAVPVVETNRLCSCFQGACSTENLRDQNSMKHWLIFVFPVACPYSRGDNSHYRGQGCEYQFVFLFWNTFPSIDFISQVHLCGISNFIDQLFALAWKAISQDSKMAFPPITKSPNSHGFSTTWCQHVKSTYLLKLQNVTLGKCISSLLILLISVVVRCNL